ncbi:DUF1450 domain-containing protein [Ammoniphilus sp. CFH 90114]|uniref:DUF1450 domain-containing protein n=1 Tax=Ammoniphilus sp. CFH 90114 TaxID=2493665 RepID=UPI0010100322|nr:DUF1450 domain-containing protein [Ammoniphilus sp. CFH 90114]RXT01932.1 DUF1450 domain-containing protein [Ammoniphilus sp. CFH 90114]
MGIVIVEVCNANFITAFDLEELEQEFPEASVIRMECLNLCGLCSRSPYALVNGKRVFAKTIEECVKLIKERIKEELAEF